jgi:hypothetical protein
LAGCSDLELGPGIVLSQVMLPWCFVTPKIGSIGLVGLELITGHCGVDVTQLNTHNLVLIHIVTAEGLVELSGIITCPVVDVSLPPN